MRFSLLALGATAAAAWSIPSFPSNFNPCLGAKDAQNLVAVYQQLIGNYSLAEAQKYLASDFTDTSDSINTLIHEPLGSTTFPSPAIFEAAQAANPKIPVDVLSVDAITCDTIVLTWKVNFGATTLPAKGISILTVVFEGGAWKFKAFKVEFNSIIYALNAGGSYGWEGQEYTDASPDPSLF